jgi:hypothetical protein
LNAGNVSVSGQLETANGFLVKRPDVQEHMNRGTSIVPNLDSIEEFRVLTNNFDPEHGNYNGGIIKVVTKSDSDALHGTAFEFFRNKALDERNYFSPVKSVILMAVLGWRARGWNEAAKCPVGPRPTLEEVRARPRTVRAASR